MALLPASLIGPTLLVALSLASPVFGVEGVQPRDRSATVAPTIGDNAALVYYSVWINDDREKLSAFAEAYSDMQFGKAQPQAVADFLKQREFDIKRLVRAGQMNHCDFGIDRSEGFNTLLPHLAKLRSVARILNADAARCLLEGKPDDAADRFVAIFGLARHAASDRILISSLVSIAIANVPVNGLVESNGASQLTPAGRAKVLAAIDKFQGGAGFRLKDAIEGEREMAVDATILKYDGPGAGRKFADEVLREAVVSGAPGAHPEQEPTPQSNIEKVRQMDGAALQAEASKLNAFYDEVKRVWDGPNVDQRLKELSAAAEKGEYGVLGAFLLPALTKCHTSEVKGVEALQRIAQVLRKADAAESAAKKPK